MSTVPLTEAEQRNQEREKYVKLRSGDGMEFFVEKKAACVSNTVKQMLGSDSGFIESEKGEITFPEISGAILELVCQYFHFKLRYQNMPTKLIPEFAIPTESALELLKAANFLDA